MRKLTKTLAALLFILAVVVAAGCKKPDDPTDPNNPNNGGGGNGGGNGGGGTPTTEGIYLGIIGFNYNLFPKEISFLDNTTKSSFTSFIDNLTTENLTALYYADYAALKNLNLYSEPPRLTNVALVTFTDGLDNASLDDDERNPENYPTRDAYLNALHSKIKTEKIHGLDVNAYTIGLRGNDVHDVVAFQNNLKKLASDDQNVFEVTSMDEALQHFEEIAESLHWTSVTTSLTLLVPPGYDDGMVLRFTFDQGNSAANSALCIECTYKRGDNVRRLENIQYVGFEQGASSLSSVEKLPNGFYKFVFEQLEKKNGQGYITEEDRNRMKLYRRISTGWEPETEFDNSNQSSIVNEQNSALIMLVLDCTTSLGSQFSSLKVGAKNFVETLVNANSGGGLTRFTVSVSANPTEAGTVSGGGTFNSGALRTITATANDGYAFTNWTENGSEVSTNPNYSFTLNTNRTFVANFTATAPNQYTINVSANPTDGGMVGGGGAYEQGDTCTVRTTANSGYAFINWTENGDEVSTSANYTFIVNGHRTLVANFEEHEPETYTVSVSANPSNGGTVSGGGTFQQGQSCTLVATAASGFVFQKWTKNGTQVSTNATYTFTVTESASYVAHFDQQSYNISLSASPSNGGTVSGGGVHYYGQPCTVHAVANSGYTFTNWTENGSVVSTNANYNFTVTGNRTLEAHFAQQSQAPTGAINGRFSVSAGQRVYFSQGNLQYQASTSIWQFATNQYDYIGSANSNISQTYSGWIDLFGWGTSGWNCGNTYYRPWDSNNSDGSLYGPPGWYNLTGSYANSDWGYYNAISNGGSQSHQWRTLTQSEWDYVFNTRSTNSGIRYAKAQVAGVNGVILLPDDWSSSFYTLYSTNSSGASFSSNVISSSTWTNSLQSHGAVFLPAAGNRNRGTSVFGVGSYGYYWSASYRDSDDAWNVFFGDGYLGTDSANRRYLGRSVRLVCPAE